MTLLPNIITLLRIAGSLGLLLCDVANDSFWIIYVLCGISDIADGWLARKLKRVTKAGAQGKGIGSEMIREAIHLAQSKDMQAIRLDALASNTPAHKIYERLGFEYRGKQHLYAENTSWTDFYFFELKQ